MSESKHTPGPWWWDGDPRPGCSAWDVGTLRGAKGACVMYYEIDNANKQPNDYKPFGCTTPANARLIASTPNLLAAGEEVVRRVFAIGVASNGVHVAYVPLDAHNALVDAIALATKEQPCGSSPN